MPQMTFTEILEICRERANWEPPDRAIQRVRGKDIRMDRSRVDYRIPHSDDQHVLTSDFEREGFSLMPTNARGNPTAQYARYWGIKRQAIDWRHELYWRHKAHGIQLFMAHASAKEIAGVVHYPICWDIEEGLLKEHPEVFERVLRWALEIPNVSLIISKSGGFRMSAWVPFVRPKTDQIVARHEWRDTETGKISGETYAEILSEKGLARIDDRYLRAVGDIAKWPVLTEEEFLKPLTWLTPLDARLAQPNREAIVEEELGADLPEDLTWQDGKYVLISVRRYDCEMGHRSNPTVEYRKYRDGRIVRVCYAGCGEKVIRRGRGAAERTLTDVEKIEAIREGNLSPFAIRRQPPKLVKEPFEITLANIENNRERIKNALRQPNKVVLLKSWTGDGKGEGCIQLALDGEKFMMGASTQENADEDAERFRQAAKRAGVKLNVLRWYPVKHKFDPNIPVDERLDEGAMCAFADIREAYQSKGGNPYTICASCRFHQQCEEQGYLSQRPKMREADVLIFCFPGIVTNPDYEVQAERYLELPDELARDTNGQLIPRRNDSGEIVRDERGDPIYEYEKRYRSVIYDEATAQDLFVECRLPIRLIEQWRDMWEGEHLSEFAQDLICALVEKDPIPKLRRVVKVYTQVADEIVAQMCALRYSARFIELPAGSDKVGFKGYMYINETQTEIPVAKNWEVYSQLKKDGVAVLKPDVTSKTHLAFRDLDQAVSYKVFDRTDVESIHNMPTVSSRKDWTYWHKLKALFDEFPHDEMLPLVCPDHESGSGTNYISWHIHPRLHPKVPRVIFMGASLDIELGQSVLRGYKDDMFVEETPPTKFTLGASFLQLVTAKYPRRTLLERGKEIGKYIGLSQIGKKVTGLIRREIRQNPSKKFGIITFKWIVDTFRNAWCNECPNLVYFENFARAKGTNPELDVLFVLGLPDIPQYDVEVAAKMLFGATERGATPLDTTRLKFGVRHDGCPYVDSRMQSAWRLLVVESLLQAIGRGRLNLKPRCVVALTAVRLPNLTDRKETVLFDLVDWEIAGRLDRLPQTVVEREKKADDYRKRLESGETVYAIAKDEGIQWQTVKRIVTPYRGDQVDNILVKRDSRVTIGAKLTKLQKEILSCFETASGNELKTGDVVKIVGRARSKVTSNLSKLVDRFYLERVKHGWYRFLSPESRDLRLRFMITFMLHLAVESYTNVQIADILKNPLEDVNAALRKLGESSWCLLHGQDNVREFVVEIDWEPQTRFEVFTDTDMEHLLAFGTVYGDHNMFMLCDLKNSKFRGDIEQFIDDAYETFGLSDDASIAYADFSKWRALKLIYPASE